MAKLTPNVPYEDLGDRHQIAEFSAAWVKLISQKRKYSLVNNRYVRIFKNEPNLYYSFICASFFTFRAG
jgi:hypothetical protein